MPRYTWKEKLLGDRVDEVESSICEKCIFSDCHEASRYCRLNIYWHSMMRLDRAYRKYNGEQTNET